MASVIFDLDGTLVDTVDLHARSFVEAFREFGYDVSEEDVKKLVGVSGREIVRRLAGEEVEGLFQRKVELFLERLDEVGEVKGAGRLLELLKERGLKIGLATSSNRKMTDFILKKFGWDFDFVVTADDVPRAKPDPTMLAMAVEALGGPAVYVGDSRYDRQMAEWCGVDSLILGRDVRSLEEVLKYRFGRVATHGLASREIVGTPVFVSGNRARALLLAKRDMAVDESGLVHGSFTFGVADLAAMLSTGEGALLKSASVNFERKVFVGDVLVAEAVRDGSVADVTVRVKDKQVLSGVMEVFVK